MADQNVTELTPGDPLAGDELLYMEQGGNDRSTTPAALATYLAADGTLLDNLTDTWTSGSTNYGIKLDVTISGGATGKLFELQVGGANKFNVSESGTRTSVGSNNTTVDVLTGGSITGSGTTSFATETGTWNTTGNPTGRVVNYTRTNTGNAAKFIDYQIGGVTKVNFSEFGEGFFDGSVRVGTYFLAGTNVAQLRSQNLFTWSSTTNVSGSADTALSRAGVAIIGIRGANASTAGALSFLEQTAPSAPAANEVLIFAQDNGAGKTQLMARFNSGSAVQIAIEP